MVSFPLILGRKSELELIQLEAFESRINDDGEFCRLVFILANDEAIAGGGGFGEDELDFKTHLVEKRKNGSDILAGGIESQVSGRVRSGDMNHPAVELQLGHFRFEDPDVGLFPLGRINE